VRIAYGVNQRSRFAAPFKEWASSRAVIRLAVGDEVAAGGVENRCSKLPVLSFVEGACREVLAPAAIGRFQTASADPMLCVFCALCGKSNPVNLVILSKISLGSLRSQR
jgi:hypothetical protein